MERKHVNQEIIEPSNEIVKTYFFFYCGNEKFGD